MKNIQILKWLTSLTEEKLIRAILMITIFTVFSMYISSQREAKDLRTQLYTEKEMRRVEERQRTDSFNLVIRVMQTEYSRKTEQYLKEQLEKFEKANKVVTKAITTNSKLIKTLKHAK